MLAKLERDFLEADIAAVTKLLSVHPEDEDPIEHFQYAQRLEMLQAKIRELNARMVQEPCRGGALLRRESCIRLPWY